MSKAVSSTMLVLNRNYVLTSTKGHSIGFVKGEPTHVPPALYQEALAIGAVPPNGEDPAVVDPPKADAPPSDPAERAALIMTAIEQLVVENTRESFTAAGAPAVDAVAKLVGFKAQAKEIATVWQQYHDKVAAEKSEA